MSSRLLPPALLLLLQTSVHARTTDATELAALLFLSPDDPPDGCSVTSYNQYSSY